MPLYTLSSNFKILVSEGSECQEVMHIFGATQKKVVMVVDRSGIHRARKLASTLEHYKGKFELHFLPAHSGHHLNPIEGFWRRMKEVIGAGRCFEDLQQLYRRTPMAFSLATTLFP